MASMNREQKEQTRSRPRRRLIWLGCILIAPLAYIALHDRETPDSKRKEAVYRMYAGYKKDFPQVKDISPQQAMELQNQGKLVFVDIRKPEEMAVSMLPTAVSQQDFLSNPTQYKNKTVVGYCTISYRSGVFASEMAKKGITMINLQGGILAWTLEGGKVYDAGGRQVKRIHVYGDRWDYAPNDYESVKFSLWRQIL